VTSGSCNNSFTISAEAQEKLLSTPPTPLSEIYYECTRSEYDSFISALGVSVGNAVVVRNVIILLIASLFILYHRIYQPVFHTYTNREREKVLHFLAFNLLLARDGMYPTPSHTLPPLTPADKKEKPSGTENSVILKLQSELSIQTNVKRFYNLDDEQESQSTSSVVELEMGNVERNSSVEIIVSSNLSRSSSTISSSASIAASKHLSNERVLNPLSTSSSLSVSNN
jgi:hypothetical protein